LVYCNYFFKCLYFLKKNYFTNKSKYLVQHLINLITIVFCVFHSEHHILKHLKIFSGKIPIIVIDNGRNIKFKDYIEKKFKKVSVIIPDNNIGIAGAYNLGLKKSKTKFVMLCPADVILELNKIKKLLNIAKRVNKFSVLGMVYEKESIYKNYEANQKKPHPYIKDVYKVDIIDNSYLVNKDQIGNKIFDENYFLFFETWDFCRSLKYIYIYDKIKFIELGGQSHNKKINYEMQLARAWHYNWSRFYYTKKFNGLFYSYRKSLKYFLKFFIQTIASLIIFNTKKALIHYAEFAGLLNSILGRSSFYRPLTVRKFF